MNSLRSTRPLALFEALLVTVIWASSFILVKLILPEVGPLTIAGVRYFLAFLILIPMMLRAPQSIKQINQRLWLQLALIGLSAYTIGNGALFWGLQYLPATTVSFLMSLSPLLILFSAAIWLNEFPKLLQILGVFVSLIGSVLFFYSGLKPGEPLGIAITLIGMVGFTAFGILGRDVARQQRTSTLLLTGIPLAIGGGVLLIVGIPLEGWEPISLGTWLMLIWLAIINTAFAYLIYNHALKLLSALEMNIILNLAPLVTALLALTFLGESLSVVQLAGMMIMIIGVILVQAKPRRADLPHSV
jgi:drug/metabolite transporter (DMT)-like permease